MQQPQIQMLVVASRLRIIEAVITGVSFLGAGMGYVENRFAEQPVPASPGEERP